MRRVKFKAWNGVLINLRASAFWIILFLHHLHCFLHTWTQFHHCSNWSWASFNCYIHHYLRFFIVSLRFNSIPNYHDWFSNSTTKTWYTQIDVDHQLFNAIIVSNIHWIYLKIRLVIFLAMKSEIIEAWIINQPKWKVSSYRFPLPQFLAENKATPIPATTRKRLHEPDVVKSFRRDPPSIHENHWRERRSAKQAPSCIC